MRKEIYFQCWTCKKEKYLTVNEAAIRCLNGNEPYCNVCGSYMILQNENFSRLAINKEIDLILNNLEIS